MPTDWEKSVQEILELEGKDLDLNEVIVKEIRALEEKEKTSKQVTTYSYEGSTAPRVLDHISASQWVKLGVWVNIQSSNVDKIKYDARTGDLFVQFFSGGVGYYIGVEPHAAADFFNSGSLGVFLHKRLKNSYSYRKIT